MNKVTGDMVSMVAQIPALFETLSGMQMSDLFSKIRAIGDNAPKPDGGGNGNTKAGAAGAGPQK